MKISSLFFPLLLAGAAAPAADWQKLTLSRDFFSEGGTFGDLNRDGVADVVSGPFWYAGPDFSARHELYAPAPFDPMKYSDNFFAFVADFNADGWNDVFVIGFPGKDATWLENPGAAGGAWSRHAVFAPVDNESPTFGDLLGDGRAVLMCMSGGRLGYARPDPAKPMAPWTFHAVTPPRGWQTYTHGLGFGDVNGDGRADLLEAGGWWEQPASLAGNPLWRHHPAAFGKGAQILVTDVNGDGRADVISSLDAHGYGLAWFEQLPPQDGETSFRRHDILSAEGAEQRNGIQFSQLHALALADVDGDGLPDIVTGKRRWAHGTTHDPEPTAAPVVYAFLLRRSAAGAVTFEPRLVDDASGVGTQVVARDINGDKRADILSTNKSGTSVFLSPP
jgi:hypothetical protein